MAYEQNGDTIRFINMTLKLQYTTHLMDGNVEVLMWNDVCAHTTYDSVKYIVSLFNAQYICKSKRTSNNVKAYSNIHIQQ